VWHRAGEILTRGIMPKYRQLHTKILDSFDFNEMPDDFIRVTWVLLPLILDSEGRGIYNFDWVKAKMYPLRNNITGADIQDVFNWLEDRNMIVKYESAGRLYFYVPTFKQYQQGTQKEAKSLLPSPPELLQSYSRVDHAQVCAAESASESESVLMIKDNSIFSLYESEIGIITPMIAEEIIEAEKIYPIDWFQAAFQEAARNNKRSWAYAKAILKRWSKEGYKTKTNGSSHSEIPEKLLSVEDQIKLYAGV
jgi:DnaD/phage-associated family protein